MYFAEDAQARPSAEPTTDGELGEFPEYLRCLLPAEGELAPEEIAKVEALVMEYWDIFMGPGDAPGSTDSIHHKSDTGDATPIKQNYFRRSQKEREYGDAELDKMLESGVIHPSKSPWGAPVVLIRKKLGEL